MILQNFPGTQQATEDLAIRNLAFAEEAAAVYRQAIAAGQPALAYAASLVAATIFLKLGKRYEALSSRIDHQDTRFSFANSADDYRAVLIDAIADYDRAREIDAADLAFRAVLLAADSCYFAAQASRDAGDRHNYLRSALGNLLVAADWLDEVKSQPDLERFASLASSTFAKLEEQALDSEDEVRDQLQQLAGAMEAHFPAGFTFSHHPADPFSVALELATLSFGFSSPFSAYLRLNSALDQAEAAGNLQAWVELAFTRYKGLREVNFMDGNMLIIGQDAGDFIFAGAEDMSDIDAWMKRAVANNSPEQQLARLRQDMLARAGRLRRGFRSRAGRLLAAQQLEPVFGEMIRDDSPAGAAQPEHVYTWIESGKSRYLLDGLCLRAEAGQPAARHRLALRSRRTPAVAHLTRGILYSLCSRLPE